MELVYFGFNLLLFSMASTSLNDIHENFDNYRFLPKIEGMKVEEYVINISIVNRICIVSNKVMFKPAKRAITENVRNYYFFPINMSL